MKNLLTATGAALVMVAAASAWAGGDINAGKVAVEKFGCAACHGADLNSPIDPTYPKLAGQHQDYLKHVLIAYQRGAQTPKPLNSRVNAIINGQATAL